VSAVNSPENNSPVGNQSFALALQKSKGAIVDAKGKVLEPNDLYDKLQAEKALRGKPVKVDGPGN